MLLCTRGLHVADQFKYPRNLYRVATTLNTKQYTMDICQSVRVVDFDTIKMQAGCDDPLQGFIVPLE